MNNRNERCIGCFYELNGICCYAFMCAHLEAAPTDTAEEGSNSSIPYADTKTHEIE